MNITISISDVFTRTRNITIPSKCPHCEKEMVGQSAIKEIAYRPESMFMDVSKEGEIEEYSMGNRLESEIVVEYRCGNCDGVVASGEEAELEPAPCPPHIEVNNGHRAAWAAKALALFSAHTGIQGEDAELRISDLLCDLRHLADQEGVDWDQALARGDGHYQEER